ncbi:MAG: hypothetical protein ABJB09_00550 [Verrucomicrobiota bacterium]
MTARAREPGIPLPGRYAALLAKSHFAPLPEAHGERTKLPPQSARLSVRAGGNSEIFAGSYRAAAKTSFAAGVSGRVRTLDSLFDALPDDTQMARQFPKLLRKSGNVTERVLSEKRNVNVQAWIYWVRPESDRDFHVILGSTPQLTTTTVFMNSEVSGLPAAHPTKSPFPARRSDIRTILASHRNENGLFREPVEVRVTGSLLWDGEHRAPNNVGPRELRPSKAWEIHPIRQIVAR